GLTRKSADLVAHPGDALRGATLVPRVANEALLEPRVASGDQREGDHLKGLHATKDHRLFDGVGRLQALVLAGELRPVHRLTRVVKRVVAVVEALAVVLRVQERRPDRVG